MAIAAADQRLPDLLGRQAHLLGHRLGLEVLGVDLVGQEVS
jgi:hypothetical protein